MPEIQIRYPIFTVDSADACLNKLDIETLQTIGYLSLTEQIMSIFNTPGVEALLNNWHFKLCNSEEYSDIFDGQMCYLKLRVPNGSFFFSNLSHKSHGPNNKLLIGVNLGLN